MLMPSRYLATVRRAMSMPLFLNISTIASSESTFAGRSSSIICFMRSRTDSDEWASPPPRPADSPGVAAAGYASVVFSALLGWLFWSEVPSAAAWLGGGMVVAAGLLLARDLE